MLLIWLDQLRQNYPCLIRQKDTILKLKVYESLYDCMIINQKQIILCKLREKVVFFNLYIKLLIINRANFMITMD